MKYLSLIVAVACFFVIGYMIANYYKRRHKFFGDLLHFCDLLSNEINFMQSKLCDIIDSHSSSFGVDFTNLLTAYKKYLQNKIAIGELEQDLNKSLNILNKEEFDEIIKFFSSLGGLDVDNEISNVKNYKNLFSKYSNLAEKDRQKYAPLFIKLGFVFGCMVAIIFI